MNEDSKILIVGHNDIIEKSLYEYFLRNGFKSIFSSSEIGLDTTIQSSVYQFFSENEPEYVFLGSVLSGGIKANIDSPADFFYKNSESQNNIVYAAQKFGVKKLVYFASSCVYPKDCFQPMKREYLMTGSLEETSEAYSIAKLAGIKLCQSFRQQYGLNTVVAIPATVYGPGCDMNSKNAHVIVALINKFYEAKRNNDNQVVVWGTGEARREFIFVDDFISAAVSVMRKNDSPNFIHLCPGKDVSIKELAEMVKGISQFDGQIVFDSEKPQGPARKLLDCSEISNFGWNPKVDIKEGLEKKYCWYVNQRKMEIKE